MRGSEQRDWKPELWPELLGYQPMLPEIVGDEGIEHADAQSLGHKMTDGGGILGLDLYLAPDTLLLEEAIDMFPAAVLPCDRDEWLPL